MASTDTLVSSASTLVALGCVRGPGSTYVMGSPDDLLLATAGRVGTGAFGWACMAHGTIRANAQNPGKPFRD